MSAYRVQLTEDQIAFLVDSGSTIGCAGHLDHVETEGDYLILDGTALGDLRGLTPDDDGYVDENRRMWIGGLDYEIETIA